MTTDQENAVLEMLSAFQNAKQVDDLPAADLTTTDKIIEVFDVEKGQSEKMALKDAVDMANAPYFGRVWNKDNTTPKAASWFGSLEFGKRINEVYQLGGYIVKNDHTRRKLDSENHYKYANGQPAKLDGSEGHYQWGWGTVFYIGMSNIGRTFQLATSLKPIPGMINYRIPVGSMSASGFASLKRSTSTLMSCINNDADYRGGDNSTTYDGTNKTLIGRAVTNMACEAMRAAARKNGEGWLCGTMRHRAVVKMLFEIIFGTRNCQEAYTEERDKDGLRQGGLGSGVTGFSSWGDYNGYRPFLPQDAGIELGDNCGVSSFAVKDDDGNTVYTAPIPSFFGLRNGFGYLWSHQDDEQGMANEDKSITHLVAPSIYGTWTIGSAEGMVAYSTTPTRGEGFIKTASYDNLEIFPTSIGATETTGHADYLWNTSGATSGFRLVLRSCDADRGARAGFGVVYVYDAVTYSDVDLGSPLCEANEDWPVVPVAA